MIALRQAQGDGLLVLVYARLAIASLAGSVAAVHLICL